jgi:hypothetical protein
MSRAGLGSSLLAMLIQVSDYAGWYIRYKVWALMPVEPGYHSEDGEKIVQ